MSSPPLVDPLALAAAMPQVQPANVLVVQQQAQPQQPTPVAPPAKKKRVRPSRRKVPQQPPLDQPAMVQQRVQRLPVGQSAMMQSQMMVRRGEVLEPGPALFARKRQLLSKAVRSLVYKNAALCDEVARLHQRVATTIEERKLIVKRLLHHSRLRLRRENNAARRNEARLAAAVADGTIKQECHQPVTSFMLDTSDTRVMTTGTSSYHGQSTTVNTNEITADMIEHGDIDQILDA